MQYQIGDVVLWKATDENVKGSLVGRGQQYFEGVTHAEIVFNVIEKDVVACLGSTTEGVNFRNYKITDDHIVRRIKGIEKKDFEVFQEIMLAYYENLVKDKNIEYDRTGLVDAGANTIIKHIFSNYRKNAFFGELTKYITGKDPKICSELVFENLDIFFKLIYDDDQFEKYIDVGSPRNLKEHETLITIKE